MIEIEIAMKKKYRFMFHLGSFFSGRLFEMLSAARLLGRLLTHDHDFVNVRLQLSRHDAIQ
jgi:hypothetical protein